MKILKLAAISAVLATAFISQASAHAIWIAPRHDNLAIVYGDLSDDGYDVEMIQSLKGNGVITRNDQENHVLFTTDEKTTYVSAALVRGYSTKDEVGKRFNLPKNEVENAVKSGYYVKYASSILGNLAEKPKLQGIKLEILPLVDPTLLHKGDELIIQVYYDGKPLEGAKVYRDYVTDHDTTYKTDADGKATIVIRNHGQNVIATNHNVILENNPKTDKYGYYSTLSFESFEKKKPKKK